MNTDTCNSWCSLVVCSQCGEMATRRADGTPFCGAGHVAPTVVVWREDCPHQPGLTKEVSDLRVDIQEQALANAEMTGRWVAAQAQLNSQQRFTKGTWAKDGDVIAVVEARLELRAIPIQNVESAPEGIPSVETQAEVAHLALRHHLGQVGDVIQDMCPYLSVTGGTRVTFEDVVDEPDVAEEEVPQDA